MPVIYYLINGINLSFLSAFLLHFVVVLHIFLDIYVCELVLISIKMLESSQR